MILWSDEETRELLRLREEVGLTWPEVGEALGKSEYACRRRYIRIRHPEREIVPRVRPINRRREPRPCMCCGNQFQSEGKFNRLCRHCRHDPVPSFNFPTP